MMLPPMVSVLWFNISREVKRKKESKKERKKERISGHKMCVLDLT